MGILFTGFWISGRSAEEIHFDLPIEVKTKEIVILGLAHGLRNVKFEIMPEWLVDAKEKAKRILSSISENKGISDLKNNIPTQQTSLFDDSFQSEINFSNRNAKSMPEEISEFATYEVIYKRGHFIDIKTSKPIHPIQGKQFQIVGKREFFESTEQAPKTQIALDSEDKKLKVEKAYGKDNILKMYDAGTIFNFEIGSTKYNNHYFRCKIFEDLYLYLMKNKPPEDYKSWRLVKCHCVLESSLIEGVQKEEKITAHSLNELFSNTVQYYFSQQRNSAANTFQSFLTFENGGNRIIDLKRQELVKKKNRGII